MNEDNELLRRFADEGSQEAFRALVERKVGLVFAAALRQMGGEAHLAQDVTQAVFIALAANAARLKRHAVLAGWLHTTTRHGRSGRCGGSGAGNGGKRRRMR